MIEKQVLIIGAGASGLFCAIEAGKRKKDVLVIDHANKVGKKILMSGGGRCNFTNYFVEPERFQSASQHFCKSALKRYTQWDFIGLVEAYDLPYHEKTLGQLFCDYKSKEVVEILLAECQKNQVQIKLKTSIQSISRHQKGFIVVTNNVSYYVKSLVIATGGLSIPTMGASGFGYQVAKQFGIEVKPTRAGLVPFILSQQDKARYTELSGISVLCEVSCNGVSFKENILFTHRGLSGPAILQISSYWQLGQNVEIDLCPSIALSEVLVDKAVAKMQLRSILEKYLPKRLVMNFFALELLEKQCAQLSKKEYNKVATQLHQWQVKPCSTEGYRTAEVTLGGVCVDEISSKSFEAYKVKGLYFIGEVLDVAGWLGGYNFQWAWSSAWAAGQHV